MELIAVVLGAETSKDRFAACRSMLDYGFANYALVTPEDPTAEVTVKLGKAESVAAVPAESVAQLVEKAQRNEVRVQVDMEEQVTAPVSAGQKLGTMTVYCGEQILAQVPMVASEAVSRLSWFQILGRVLRQIVMGKQ